MIHIIGNMPKEKKGVVQAQGDDQNVTYEIVPSKDGVFDTTLPTGTYVFSFIVDGVTLATQSVNNNVDITSLLNTK